MRFYAGAPLVTQKGTALGAPCVVDTKPRTLEPFQYEALRGLSRQIVALMKLRRTTKQLRHQLRERERYEAQLKRENASLAGQSRTDAQTGLPNRRSLDASLERAITFAAPPFARVPTRPCIALNIMAAIGKNRRLIFGRRYCSN